MHSRVLILPDQLPTYLPEIWRSDLFRSTYAKHVLFEQVVKKLRDTPLFFYKMSSPRYESQHLSSMYWHIALPETNNPLRDDMAILEDLCFIAFFDTKYFRQFERWKSFAHTALTQAEIVVTHLVNEETNRIRPVNFNCFEIMSWPDDMLQKWLSLQNLKDHPDSSKASQDIYKRDQWLSKWRGHYLELMAALHQFKANIGTDTAVEKLDRLLIANGNNPLGIPYLYL